MKNLRGACDVLGLGSVAVDDLLYVAGYPPPDVKTQVLRRERRLGGLTAAALMAAAALGAKCRYAGALGRDPLSQFVLEKFREGNVNASAILVRRAARPIHSSIIVGDAGQTRNVFFNLDGVTGAGAHWPPAPIIEAARVLLVDHYGLEGMVRAARIARRAGRPVVADFERSNVPQFEKLFGLADHLVVSMNFARQFTGESSIETAVRRLLTPERKVVIVTCGAEGCWAACDTAPAPRRYPAFRVKAVNTCGCGDVFHGAYSMALARGLPLQQRITLASAAAALKAAHAGPDSPWPTRGAVEKLIRKSKAA